MLVLNLVCYAIFAAQVLFTLRASVWSVPFQNRINRSQGTCHTCYRYPPFVQDTPCAIAHKERFLWKVKGISIWDATGGFYDAIIGMNAGDNQLRGKVSPRLSRFCELASHGGLDQRCLRESISLIKRPSCGGLLFTASDSNTACFTEV